MADRETQPMEWTAEAKSAPAPLFLRVVAAMLPLILLAAGLAAFLLDMDRRAVPAILTGTVAALGLSLWAAIKLGRQIEAERQTLLSALTQRSAERNAALAESEERYRLLAENSMDIIVRGSLDGIRDYVSPACHRLFGYDAGELLGTSIDSVLHPDDVPGVHEVLGRLRGAQEDILATFRVQRKEGAYVWCEGAFRLFHEEPGDAPNRFMATVRDITARKEAEEAALAAMHEANRANRSKSLFLASMSHELRTPLNAIIGFSEMLAAELAGALNAKQSDYVGYILRSGNNLLMLVQDLLAFASLEAAPLQVKIEPIELDEVLEEIEPVVAQMALARSIGVSIGRAGCAAPRLMANHHRLVQVLTNLCSNAVKYNRPGGLVELTVRIAGPGRMEIAIADTGIGIAPDKHAALFEPFNRLGAESGVVEGTGVGLAICKRLTDAMGGEIGLSSKPGMGSRFTVTLKTCGAGAKAINADLEHLSSSSDVR